ncbi:MAG: hypothetical protein LBG45_10745 [Dysgonamonadaceae bacterium]|nr:hypothetical protein [Dysgonamonadaceae bacterium]
MSIRIIRFICVPVVSKEYGFVHCGQDTDNNPVRDYSSVETFDCTTPRMTSVMRTNAASLRDAGEGGGTLFSTELCISARCRFTVHHKSLIFDKSGCTKPYRVKYNS